MATLTGQSLIIGGPSKEELFDSLRLCNEHRTVKFSLVDNAKYDVKATVAMLKPEDGSGLRWLMEVYITVDGKPTAVSGYYDTATRKGHVNLNQQENTIDLDALNREVATLSSLLADRHPGLFTWNTSVGNVLKSIRRLIG